MTQDPMEAELNQVNSVLASIEKALDEFETKAKSFDTKVKNMAKEMMPDFDANKIDLSVEPESPAKDSTSSTDKSKEKSTDESNFWPC